MQTGGFLPRIIQLVADLPHLLGDEGIRLRVATAGREDKGPEEGNSTKWKGTHGELSEVERRVASVPDKMRFRMAVGQHAARNSAVRRAIVR